MAFEGARQNLGPLDAQVDSIVLNGRDGCLRNPRQLAELALGQLLEFTQDAHRLAHGDLDALLGGTKLFHLSDQVKFGDLPIGK